MIHNNIIHVLLFYTLTFTSCVKEKDVGENTIALIPKPQQIELLGGDFSFNKETTLFADAEFDIAASFLRNYLQNGAGLSLGTASKKAANIIFEKDASQPAEGYELLIYDDTIVIKASGSGGAFYAIQTLRQLLPSGLERINSMPGQSVSVPQLKIKDAPKFSYRGMHLDVARHFFPKEYIKEFIANMALLKMNYFHWHLTDDQGWRIEILQYPDITNNGAYRDETLLGHYNDSPQQFDSTRYGGFYSQKDIKEILDYAAKHNVTVIPEIEMPGHAQAAISSYPELGCTGEEIQVATKWGVFENIFCPNEKTFDFLKNVLSEVIELFPGEYIHIGGDEAPKKHWKECDHCQELIKELELKDEQGLQSYFIKEIEAFVSSKGKKIIGWDEILEGGLAPNATVMSWRGTEGGIEAAKQKHDVIMTPTSHAYFDYYQADDPEEPLAIGGFLPLKKVYSFNPIPLELSAEESDYILGGQGNVWTEYIKTGDKLEYMLYPRIFALSEVVWSGASEEIEKDYAHFLSRLEPFMDRLDVLNINYANHLYELEGKVIKDSGKVLYQLNTPTQGKEIRYSINTSEEKKYVGPIAITDDAVINASVYKNGTQISKRFSDTLQYHKGVLGSISLNVSPHKAYSAGGKEALINGIKGNESRFGDKEWLGFWGDDLEITVDFKDEIEIESVSLRFYNANGQWIYAPKRIDVEAVLSDGRKIRTMALIKPETSDSFTDVSISLKGIKTNNIKLKIPSFGTIPEGLQGAGNKAWTFIDEIIIE